MIKPTDLRLGNLLNYHGQIVHVMGIDDVSAEFGYFKDSVGFFRAFKDEDFPKPILLTEEVLYKFGFRKENGRFFPKQSMSGNYLVKGTGCFYCSSVSPEIKFAHQIQNIFYSLSGQELTLKP